MLDCHLEPDECDDKADLLAYDLMHKYEASALKKLDTMDILRCKSLMYDIFIEALMNEEHKALDIVEALNLTAKECKALVADYDYFFAMAEKKLFEREEEEGYNNYMLKECCERF